MCGYRSTSFIFGTCLLLLAVLSSVANMPAESRDSRVAGRITVLLPEDRDQGCSRLYSETGGILGDLLFSLGLSAPNRPLI